MTPPLVSIGVPVYNGERFLRRTLDSLVAQTYPHLEIIVCDNASTDGTADIGRECAARDSRVRYVRNETNLGAIPNFLKTLALASGTYFAWTAADDVRPAGAIEACLRALEGRPDAVMAHGPLEIDLPRQGTSTRVDNRVNLTAARPSERVRAFTGELSHVAFMFGLHRVSVLREMRYGNHVAGDYFVCLQMSQRGPIVWVPTPMLVYRHQYGALENPMYERQPLTIRDLLVHRGLRRRKCWMVLGIGGYYLWVQGGRDRWRDRCATVWAYAVTFSARFRRELLTECVFLAFSPASWIVSPFVSVGRWMRRTVRPSLSASQR
jgi:glycosyltransferase involved in cell wall biosynthesis